jgi:hypothetical protein
MRLLGLGAAVLVAFAGTATVAGAADPVAILMQQSVKNALQANMNKQAPGMRITTVTCKVAKDARSGTCRANFTYKTIRGYYMLKVKQPLKGKPSYTSTSVTCFVAKTGAKVAC